MRTQIKIELFCAKHGCELEVNMDGKASTNEDLNRKNRMGARSAYEINPQLYINPCRQCEADYHNLLNSIEIIQKAKGAELEGGKQ